MAENKKSSEVITPPNMLSAKISTGGPGAVDLKALERAEAVIAELADDYLQWVNEDLTNIQEAFNRLQAAPENGQEILGQIFQISHDIKGQGGSFGYQLMTEIGNQLCRLVERMEKVGPAEIQVIGLHIDAMKRVIGDRIQGDGGNEGQEVLAGLRLMVDKFTPSS